MADDLTDADAAPTPLALNPLPRLLVRHALVGFGASTVFVAAIWLWGPKPLRELMTIGPALLLWWGCGLTFGSIQMGAAIMGLGRPEAPRDGQRRRMLPALLAVRASRPTRPR